MMNLWVDRICVVLMGDFKQCLAIVNGAVDSAAATINACMNHSVIWHKFKQFKLIRNMRLDENDVDSKLYAEQILAIGNGSFETHKIGDINNLIRIPDTWLSDSHNLDEYIVTSVAINA
eukprot:21633_1